ncbi:MAG: transcriptional repressor [Actinobacteria bacterium]|nr:transcriptional repressor [Actinomycetota bacterium]
MLALLETLGGHRTADELLTRATQSDRPLARATMYKVLSDLAEAGVVTVADVTGSAARYELTDDHHHHFVCQRCHRVLDVMCSGGPCAPGRVDGHVVQATQVIHHGVCADCS